MSADTAPGWAFLTDQAQVLVCIAHDLVGARYSGPGVFRETLREAIADGDIRRTSRHTYAAADDDNQAKQ